MNNKIKSCPYCGGEEYYIKQYAAGPVIYRMRFDGEEAENEAMHESLSYKNTSEYAWCSNCGKRLFKLESR